MIHVTKDQLITDKYYLRYHSRGLIRSGDCAITPTGYIYKASYEEVLLYCVTEAL